MHLSESPLIEVRGLRKVYQVPGGEVVALDGIDLSIERGQIYGIIGMSGAGKSTLIRCLNRLDTPTEGQILIDGQNILAMNEKQLMAMRRKVSMIFQSFNLLMQKTVARNVRYPLELAGVPKANERVKELLKLVELESKGFNKSYGVALELELLLTFSGNLVTVVLLVKRIGGSDFIKVK